jgi:hypothetical protein
VIALELLNCIDEEMGKASKWSLIKVLGNESQFHYWVEDFLVKDGFIEEIVESNRSFYLKSKTGELFHHLLKNGNIMHAFLKVSGKRLRQD